ncbi:transmembrane protein 25 isoform X3 [Xenopus laevis]|uniref:Transmembrane protein 25 isoform X3 n=1 Tax=Xenopus laevis TaxID=8355 RepID=A0A8J1L988_XENLA|nr:transmembrane protein 25 isoform X3 [Xenopus laevis]
MLLRVSLLFFQPLFQRGLGEPLQKDETEGASCEGGGPSLSWYMNGVKQDEGLGREPPFLLPVSPGSSSRLTLVETRGENCSNAWQKGDELLSVHLVRTQPASSFTLRDHDGRKTLNSSRLLLLDTRNLDTNGSLRVKVSTEERGVSQTSVSALGLLSSQVEVPLFALVVGGAGVVAGILLVNALVCCLLMKRKRRNYGDRTHLTLSTSNNMKLNNSCLPREHMSLPSNLQLNDLRPQARGPQGSSEGETQEDSSLRCGTLADAGFDRFPLVGYIYKASSVSSDEIWL